MRKIVSIVSLLIVAGCSFGPAPQESFYTLNAQGSDLAPQGALRGKNIIVSLVHLDELVDRPQWVLRLAPNRVAILEQRRWAENLSAQIPQVVAENLAAYFSQAHVSAAGRGAAPADYQVTLDVRKLEASTTQVDSEIVWTVSDARGTQLAHTRSLKQLAVSAQTEEANYTAIARTQSMILSQVSSEIARALAPGP